MSQMVIESAKLGGVVIAPPSKSLSHRVMIAAALSEGQSVLDGMKESVDIRATKTCLETLGAQIDLKEQIMTVQGCGKPSTLNDTTMFCEESGSTLRFMIPIAALSGHFVSFEGKGKLKTRPIDPYFDIFDKSEISFEYDDGLPLRIRGALKPGEYDLPGHISSQFVTGLLMSLPLLDGNSKINMTTKLESRDYVDLTIDVMEQFGVTVKNNNYESFEMSGNQEYAPRNVRVEGDYSQMAFWAVAGAIGKAPITIENATANSNQGDSRIFNIIENMGGRVEYGEGSITVYPSETRNISINVSEIPDLVPILAVLGSMSHGQMLICGGERVRLKESDRLKAIATELNKVGGHVEETPDGLIVNGVDFLTGGAVEGWNDHRIVMAMAIAASRCTGSLVIDGWKAINKSYPEFFKDYQNLGGVVSERNVG